MLPPIATIEIVESVMSPPLEAIEDARAGGPLLQLVRVLVPWCSCA